MYNLVQFNLLECKIQKLAKSQKVGIEQNNSNVAIYTIPGIMYSQNKLKTSLERDDRNFQV